MTLNEGAWDRVIRILTGIALAYVAWMTWSGPGIVFLVIGALALVTGLVGWCPVYAAFDDSTNRRLDV